MPTYTYPFANGTTAVNGYGDRWQLFFGGSWLQGEYWSVAVTSTQGDFALGVGFLHGLTPTVCFTYRNRVYVGMGSQFNFSDNGDPTGWEEQAPGAGFIKYLSQFGSQDVITAFNQLQGRLAVLAARSIQIWTVDGDPALFSLVQTLDNLGTSAPLSVQNFGDYDVVFLDLTGFRSLRSREVTLNAFPDDLGLPIDSLVQADLISFDPAGACGIIEAKGKRYWCYVNGKIYVYSRYSSSKISAWTVYLPTYEVREVIGYASVSGMITYTGLIVGNVYYYTKGNSTQLVCGTDTLTSSQHFVATDTVAVITGTGSLTGTVSISQQTTFTPAKFVLYNGKVYCRTTERLHITYGGSNGNTYDNCVAVVELPYLDNGRPTKMKYGEGVKIACAGAWTLESGTDPQSDLLKTVFAAGDGVNPNENKDSVFDTGRIPFESQGSHFKFKATSSNVSIKKAILSGLAYLYNEGASGE